MRKTIAVLTLAALAAGHVPARAAVQIEPAASVYANCDVAEQRKEDSYSADINESMCEEQIDLLMQEAFISHGGKIDGRRICVPDHDSKKQIYPDEMVRQTLLAEKARYENDMKTPGITMLRQAIVETFACR